MVRLAAQLIGALVSAVTALIWLGVMWLPSEREVLGHFGVVGAVVMLFVAILGVIAALRGHGNFMLALFLAAFLPIGAFMLWTTAPMYRLLGLLNLAYLAAAIVVRRTTARAPAGDEPHADLGEPR
ncbi:MAG: hypothetical protein PVG24_07700 [Gammaproteobacteria bacterium]|jgi:hypothetical protein